MTSMYDGLGDYLGSPHETDKIVRFGGDSLYARGALLVTTDRIRHSHSGCPRGLGRAQATA